jgi:D-hexose-6-phosphate mutarotase
MKPALHPDYQLDDKLNLYIAAIIKDEYSGLLQNLLEWSRSQTGALSFTPKNIDYQTVLNNSTSVLKSLADQKNIEIKKENDSGWYLWNFCNHYGN